MRTFEGTEKNIQMLEKQITQTDALWEQWCDKHEPLQPFIREHIDEPLEKVKATMERTDAALAKIRLALFYNCVFLVTVVIAIILAACLRV